MLRNESPLSYDEIYTDILASGNWRFSQKLRQYWTMIPPEKKYECFLEFYVTSEGRFNRNLVRWAKKYRPTDYLIDLPGEYIDKSTLEVYRASTLPPEYEFLIQNEPAWTLKKRVAEWFRDRAKLISVSRYIYKATINKDDIVAYTNCRKEYEVVQIGSVKDIQCIESPLDPKVRYLKKEIAI